MKKIKAQNLFVKNASKKCIQKQNIRSVHLRDEQLEKLDKIKNKYGVSASHILRTLVDILEQ
jgi:uncharacterized protein YaeQ